MNLIVVIVNYGTPIHVLKNLEKLVPELRYLGPNAKCWIVDNCSPDDSLSIISNAIEQEEYSDCVTLIPHSLNAGFGAGNNVAIRKSRTLEKIPDFYYLLNPDAIIIPGTLKRLADYLDQHDHVGVAGGPLLDTNGSLECGAFRLPTLRGTIEEQLGIGFISRLWKDQRVTISPPPDKEASVGWVGGASMMVSRTAIDQSGLFDEGYFLYFEELDLCKRIADCGFEIHYLPDAEVIHDSGASTGIHEANVRLPEYWHNSRSRYLRKTFGNKGLFTHNIATIIAGSIGKIYSFLRRRHSSRKHFISDIIKYNFKEQTHPTQVSSHAIATAAPASNAISIIARRPHFKKINNQLFFMASRNPMRQLNDSECIAWDALDPQLSFDDIKNTHGEDVIYAIQTFIAEELCDVFEPSNNLNRKKILIFEPHSDDAALSIGATMWKQRNDCEFTLVTLGSTSNYTSYFSTNYGPLNVNEVTAIRNRENEIFMGQLHGHYVPSNEKEATLRYKDGDWNHNFLQKNRISVAAFNNHFGTNDERANWHKTILEYINKYPSDEIWIPMGVGTHSDHGVTRDACLTALKSIQNTNIMMYQDVPYDSEFDEHKLSIIHTLEKNGAWLEHCPSEISTSFSDKLRLLNIYGSQFKLKAILSAIIRSAKPTNSDGLYEHFWKINKLPETLKPQPLFCGASYVKSIKADVNCWFARNNMPKSIRILLLMPSGQWKRHIDFLLNRYPDTKFEIISSPSAQAEIETYDQQRLNYSILPSGGKSWSKLMFKLFFARAKPTLFIAGTKRYSLAKKIANGWLQHDTIVVQTLEDFILAADLER